MLVPLNYATKHRECQQMTDFSLVVVVSVSIFGFGVLFACFCFEGDEGVWACSELTPNSALW